MKRFLSIFVSMLMLLSCCAATAWAAEEPSLPLAASAAADDDMADSDPEAAPDGEPDAAPDDDPDGEPDAAPDADPDGEPDAAPDDDPDDEPDAAPDDDPDDVPEDVPEIEMLSGPEFKTNSHGQRVCYVSALLSQPLDKELEQTIHWRLNWTTLTDKDTTFVTTSGTVSTLFFAVAGDQEYRVTAQVFQGRKPLGEETRLPIFEQELAAEDEVVIESLEGLPEQLPVGETATVTATMSRPLNDDEEIKWVIDTGVHTGDVETEGNISTCPFTPADVHIGEHVIYAYVAKKNGSPTGTKLLECLVIPAEEPIIPVALEKKEDSPIDVEIEASEGGGSVVYNLPISTPAEVTSVSEAANIFVVPEGSKIQVLDANDDEVAADKPFATGQKICVFNEKNQVTAMGTVMIKGDVNGTGMLNIAQLTRMAAALNGSDPLSGLYLEAGDLTGSGNILVNDLAILARMMQKAA